MAVILQLVSICHEYIHLYYESRVYIYISIYMYRYFVCMYVCACMHSCMYLRIKNKQISRQIKSIYIYIHVYTRIHYACTFCSFACLQIYMHQEQQTLTVYTNRIVLPILQHVIKQPTTRKHAILKFSLLARRDDLTQIPCTQVAARGKPTTRPWTGQENQKNQKNKK